MENLLIAISNSALFREQISTALKVHRAHSIEITEEICVATMKIILEKVFNEDENVSKALNERLLESDKFSESTEDLFNMDQFLNCLSPSMNNPANQQGNNSFVENYSIYQGDASDNLANFWDIRSFYSKENFTTKEIFIYSPNKTRI